MIVLSNAIVDPRTVMIYFANTSLAHATMVGSLGFDTAALGALVHRLVFLKTHSLNISGSGVSYGYRPGIRRHRLQMRGTCEGDGFI